jgi:hypothetical protein
VFEQTTRDLAIMGIYYLCQPGKAYAPSTATCDSDPFCLCDVEFTVGSGLHRVDTIPLHLLAQATGIRLEFTSQKHSNSGEKIVHGLSGNLIMCPTKAMARLVTNLCRQNAPRTMPLHCANTSAKLSVHAWHITTALRHAATTIQHNGH